MVRPTGIRDAMSDGAKRATPEEPILTTDELEAALEAEPWLPGYLEVGDVDLVAARRPLRARPGRRRQGAALGRRHVTARYRRGDMITTTSTGGDHP